MKFFTSVCFVMILHSIIFYNSNNFFSKFESVPTPVNSRMVLTILGGKLFIFSFVIPAEINFCKQYLFVDRGTKLVCFVKLLRQKFRLMLPRFSISDFFAKNPLSL